MFGTVVTGTFLSGRHFPVALGWRLAFLSGLPIGLIVLALRRTVPESPRWLMARGRGPEAIQVLQQALYSDHLLTERIQAATAAIPLRSGINETFRLLIGPYRRRAMVCLCLMTAQALFYNSIFFSLTLVLIRFYGATATRVGYAFLPIALANFLGPVMLGKLFDTKGRRLMTGGTFMVSGGLLMTGGLMFWFDWLNVTSQIACWTIIFFVASTSASAAYLSVSELFPQEVRASAIALFYSIGTLLGGVSGPLLFGHIVGSGSRSLLFAGYAIGAFVMMAAGIVQAVWGVAAERQPLESLRDLSSTS